MALASKTARYVTHASIGAADFINAAIAPACGAAAEVPENVRKSVTDVATPSAAVRSGF